MNKFFKPLSILAAIALFATACGAQAVQAQPEEQAAPKAATYQTVLGKSVSDKEVADFIASNNCSNAGQFQLCNDAGIALWLDSGKVVETVYLYPASADGFVAYKGELPFGLASNDTMATVEQKFGRPKVSHAPQAGWEPGLPDEGSSPDHIHYWAIYRRFGVTIVYNSPSASDKSATVHAILINAKGASASARLRQAPEFQRLPDQMIENEIFPRSLQLDVVSNL
jgi:hypothetical protein